MDIQVAKITDIIALEILGQLSNDNIRYFNPRLDDLGNWIMDLEMAIDNNIEHELFIFDSNYYQTIEKIQQEKQR